MARDRRRFAADDADFDDDYNTDDWQADDDSSDVAVEDCDKCGAEIYADAPRCPKCGAYQSREDTLPSRKANWVVLTALLCLLLIGGWILML